MSFTYLWEVKLVLIICILFFLCLIAEYWIQNHLVFPYTNMFEVFVKNWLISWILVYHFEMEIYIKSLISINTWRKTPLYVLSIVGQWVILDSGFIIS